MSTENKHTTTGDDVRLEQIKKTLEAQHASLGKRLEDIKKQVVDLQSFIKNKR